MPGAPSTFLLLVAMASDLIAKGTTNDLQPEKTSTRFSLRPGFFEHAEYEFILQAYLGAKVDGTGLVKSQGFVQKKLLIRLLIKFVNRDEVPV